MSLNEKDNLNQNDRNNAINSLRQLATGVPIYDDENKLIGFIEKPDLNAIKYIIEETKNWEERNNW